MDFIYTTATPLGLDVLLEVRRFLGVGFQPMAIDPESFQRRLTAAYQRTQNEAAQMADDISADVDLSRLIDEIPDVGDLMDAEDDAPIIRLINAVLSQAVKDQASDIHIETFEDRLSVRYRVDGVLKEILSPKRTLAPLLVSRLKVMAKLDIAEKRVPQDGRISIRIAGHAVDIRMSTIPSAHGERVVLRLLDKQAGQLELTQLNMNDQVAAGYRRGLARPHGIILVTGPTGSGKTTTLYAALQQMDRQQRNIMTVEDPVEYDLPGVSQTQINLRAGMTFARGLRAILRQDPDVILIGEIRDGETAEIATQASLTGHLVLSTLHTNTAAGAITRLQDLGVDSFLLASTVRGIISQRLMRKLCTSCRKEVPADDYQRELLKLPKGATIFQSQGCEACSNTGFAGRQALFELVTVNASLQTLIHENAGEIELEQSIRKDVPSIREAGFELVKQGVTTVEEVLRVTSV